MTRLAGAQRTCAKGRKPQQIAATIVAVQRRSRCAASAQHPQATNPQPRISGRKRVLYTAQMYEKARVQVTTAAARGDALASRQAARHPATAIAVRIARINWSPVAPKKPVAPVAPVSPQKPVAPQKPSAPKRCKTCGKRRV